jgi:tetratricopeptide (TPR) repeat protein
MTYIRAEQKEKAVAVLEEIVKRNPDRFETYNTLGDLYEDLEKDEKAIANYQLSLVLNPNQLDLYVRITLAQLRLKQPDAALKTLATAKEKFPTKYQVQYLYGLVYSEQKQYAPAVAAFADAESLSQEAPEGESKPTTSFYYAYGSTCERTGDIDKAATLFRKAIALDPKNHNAYNYLGYMWADKGLHLDESLGLIQKALQISPDNGAYLDSLGWVLFKLGRPAEALPHLRRAAELTKDDATVLDHLAEVLFAVGQRDEAIHTLERAQKAEPDNKDIVEKLHRYTAAPPAPALPQAPTP